MSDKSTTEANGTSAQEQPVVPPDPKAEQRKAERAALEEKNRIDQESAKQTVNLSALNGKVVNFRPESATEMWLLAQYYFAAKNCLGKNLGGVGDMFAKLMAGRALDIDSITAIRAIDIVEGKIFIEGDLVHAILNTKMDRSKGEYVDLIDSTDKGATYEFMRAGWKVPKRGTFDESDAKPAGLLLKKGPWETYRKAMYRHRAMITWAREYCPEWFLGVYTKEEGEEFGRDVNARPASGTIIPATSAPTQVDTAPVRQSAGALEAPAPKVRLEDPKEADTVAAKRDQAAPAQESQQAEKPAAAAPTDEDRALDVVGKAETPDAFASAFSHVQNLGKASQVEPRLALIRQIDIYLGKPGVQPTADLGKMIFRLVSGLPDDRRELGQKVYARHKWPKS